MVGSKLSDDSELSTGSEDSGIFSGPKFRVSEVSLLIVSSELEFIIDVNGVIISMVVLEVSTISVGRDVL